MTKQEALQLMDSGIKITHKYFGDTEWMTVNGKGNILLEDGCQCSIEEFFSYRTDKSWDDGYELYESEIEQENEPKYFMPESLENIYPYSMIDSFYDMDYGLTKKQREAIIVPVRTTPKIGRNEPCTCGSGRKNKHCCKQF